MKKYKSKNFSLKSLPDCYFTTKWDKNTQEIQKNLDNPFLL